MMFDMIDLKHELLEYLDNVPETDKVIKSEEIKFNLSNMFTGVLDDNSNKTLKIKFNMVIYDLTTLPVCECGSTLEFVAKDKSRIYTTKFGGWREFCSKSCMQKSPTIVNKRKNTNLERYGETSYAKTDQFKKDFSVEWSDEKKESYNIKRKSTNQERYGVDHYSKTKEYIENRENTCLELYGVTNTFLLKDRVLEGKRLVFSGYDSWIQTEEGREYMKKFNPMFDPKIIEKSRLNRYEKTWGSIRKDFLECIINQDKFKFIEIVDELFEKHNKERVDVSSELNVSYSTLCRYIRNFDLKDRYISPKGAPSESEREIYNFIKSMFPDTIQSDRLILGNKKEIDIYVPSKNLAIEYDSLFYHSEYNGSKDSNYHIEKTNICLYN